jgi:hypothetical protein
VRSDRLDAAGVHHDDLVGHGDGGQAMRDHQHCDQLGHVRDRFPQRRLVDRVKLGGSLVQQQ